MAENNLVAIHILHNNLLNASRLKKEVTSLSETGKFQKIIVFGMGAKTPKHDFSAYPKNAEFHLIDVNVSNPIFKKMVYGYRCYKQIKNIKADFVQPHSVETLPIAAFYKLKHKSTKVIYDAHELETKKRPLKNWKDYVMTFMFMLIERILFRRFIDAQLVVSANIKKWYEKRFNHSVYLVRNISSQKPLQAGTENPEFSYRKIFKIEKEDLIFVYTGAMETARNTDLLLEVFKDMQPNKHLVLMGSGRLVEKAIQYAEQCPNIHFLPSVPMEDILHYTSSADIGFSILRDSNLNHRYCLPNKFFEYMLAGIPVMASDFEEMGFYIDKYKCGVKVKPEFGSIREAVAALTKEQVNEMKKNAVAMQADFDWKNEAKEMFKAYGI